MGVIPGDEHEGDKRASQRTEADAELEREIRRDRKFSLAEAIGRLAGPGSMKGASPIPRQGQVELEIEEYLRREMADSSGALCTVVLRHVKQSPRLLDDHDRPLAVLAACLQTALDSEQFINELVREADVEWGRILDERPHFQREGSPPHPDDPYTVESVRRALSRVLEKLTRRDA